MILKDKPVMCTDALCFIQTQQLYSSSCHHALLLGKKLSQISSSSFMNTLCQAQKVNLSDLTICHDRSCRICCCCCCFAEINPNQTIKSCNASKHDDNQAPELQKSQLRATTIFTMRKSHFLVTCRRPGAA